MVPGLLVKLHVSHSPFLCHQLVVQELFLPEFSLHVEGVVDHDPEVLVLIDEWVSSPGLDQWVRGPPVLSDLNDTALGLIDLDAIPV